MDYFWAACTSCYHCQFARCNFDNGTKIHLFTIELNSQEKTNSAQEEVVQQCFSLCRVFPAGLDNSPRCDFCSAEPDTAVATLRTHRTEVNLFRCILLLFICSLRLSCLTFPFAEVYGSCFLAVILESMWTAGMLTVSEMWCWAVTACGLDKMDRGRRRFWVMSEKCQGVLHGCLSPIFSVLFWLLLNRSLRLFWSLLLLNQQLSLSQKFHLHYPLHVSLRLFIFFLLFPTKNTQIRIFCLGSSPGFNNRESKSSLVRSWDS